MNNPDSRNKKNDFASHFKQDNVEQKPAFQQKAAVSSAFENSQGGGDSRQAKINLPTGGGAIRGIGEKFEANPVTGTASFSVPIALSEGRDGFTPQLSLNYDSGSGNSVFGLGWSIGLPSITRKTDKKLPRYDDNLTSESDTFILSGAEDLVPLLDSAGNRIVRSENGYDIYSYLPRIEGLFALIERWEEQSTRVSHWRSVSRDNITSVYGFGPISRIADPDNPRKVFSWMIEESWDAKGNLMRFIYRPEDSMNVPESCFEHHRIEKNIFSNHYLKEVLYGNESPIALSYAPWSYSGNFYFRLRFDYGDENGTWPVRSDAFSSYKAGFEIRTYRLCQRMQMFHNFPSTGGTPLLVRTTELTYSNANASFTLLKRVVHKSYDGATEETLPPLDFDYTEAVPADTFTVIPQEQLRHLPASADSRQYQWTDLYGEGLSGLLSLQNNAFYFMPNYGDRQFVYPEEEHYPVFGGLKSQIPKPAAWNNKQNSFRLNDIDNDGLSELVVQGNGLNGFYARDEEGKWLPFRSFKEMPNIDSGDTHVRFMDLTGNGTADMVVSKGDSFNIYFCEGKKGYGACHRVRCGILPGNAPQVVFSDALQRIFLADMSGDGLTDIVKITHASIVYWPNLGYGRFGEKVVMGTPPTLDSLGEFDPRFVYLADVDGTGTTDLLYIAKGRIRYIKNLSGNAWQEQPLSDSLTCDNSRQTSIQVFDLYGNGTQCIVETQEATSPQNKRMRCWELTSGIKPFLLKEIANGMGAFTRLYYVPSTQFYVQDKLNGTPWITKLPFPVQVLERVEKRDAVSNKSFTHRYAYHHGYYDHSEREFRGFGMVEQWDTEEYEMQTVENTPDFVPPVHTKTWFHTGFYSRREKISRQYEEEYFQGDTEAWQLPDTELPADLSGEEAREACRALKGSPLRIEVYAQDGSALQTVPYTVEEKSYLLKCLQHKENNAHAVFLKTESQTLSYAYERQTADPRIMHKLVIETDCYGNETKTVQVAYPRRSGSLPEQTILKMTYTENDFINDTTQGFRRIGVPFQSRQFEIHNYPYLGGALSIAALLTNLPTAVEIDYADTPSQSLLQKRLFQHQRTRFWDDTLTAPLPLGQIAAQALPYQQEMLELTQVLVNQLNSEGTKITATLLENECGYLYENSRWFALGERTYYSATEFYLPVRTEDAWGNATEMEYDSYLLFPTKITDALGNETVAEYDYRVLQPFRLTETNGNATEVAFDTLGMVAKLAITGKNGEGDTLTNPTEDYDYNIHCWELLQKPVYAHVRKRETHVDPNTRWIESYVYSNGFGEEIMTKTTAADGLAWTIENDLPVEVETDHRWRSSGKVIVNNKNKPVKQYEPWYSVTSDFEDEERLTLYGVTPILHYDPLSRLIQTDFPDNTMTKVVFDAWQQKNYDQNDCDAQSPHYNTPQIIDLDGLGRPFQTQDDNGTYGLVITHNQLDISGRIVQVTDALGRTTTQNKFALSEKHQIYVENIDSGKRWMINDTAGNRRYLWDSRSHCLQTDYDVLLRPIETLLITDNNPVIATQKITYGTNAVLNNIGQVIEVKSQDAQTSFEYDFKGNVTKKTKQFAQDYQNELDWNGTVTLINEIFATQTTYDALNRPVTATQPDNSTISYIYDKGGLLKQVLHNSTQHITNITYNPREQRENIYYENNTKTRYYYNPLNFRLTRILTTRNNGQDTLQDLNYYYDAVGNITGITDNAQQTFYFNNAVIAPTGIYTYDALYRLLTATGREIEALQMPTHEDFPNNIPCPNPGPNAMQNYTHHYQYDELGNMLQMSSQNQWTRDYIYDTATNRLLKHDSQQTFDDYTYDEHGNMLSMPHLSNMSWDYLDQLHSATNGTFVSYYNYDAEGNRTRKVVVKGNITEIRYYIGNYELYQKHVNGSLDFERTTLNISDDEKVFLRIEQKTGENEVIRYQYDNHLGSACLELDELGAIISYEEYHPFGTTSYRSGRSETEVSLKRYKYCGKERDEETGLYYYGMRYYAAWICRFVSVDPLQFKYPELTPFQYASNSPVTMIDLDGGEGVRPEENHNESVGVYDQNGNLVGTPENPIILKEVIVSTNAPSTDSQWNNLFYNFTDIGIKPVLMERDPFGGLGKYAQTPQTVLLADMPSYHGEILPAGNFSTFVMWLDSPSESIGESIEKIAANLLYSMVNSPYSLITGQTITGTHLNPKERTDAFVDVVPSFVLGGLNKSLPMIKTTSDGLKGYNEVMKESKNLEYIFKGKNWQKDASKLYKTNKKNQKIKKDIFNLQKIDKYGFSTTKEIREEIKKK